jgi:hypothetical protein
MYGSRPYGDVLLSFPDELDWTGICSEARRVGTARAADERRGESSSSA